MKLRLGVLTRDEFFSSLCKLHPQSRPGPIYPKKSSESEFQARLVTTKPDDPNYREGTAIISIVNMARSSSKQSPPNHFFSLFSTLHLR
ncbi:hypothetical protein KCU67_g5994, partial [Aureobasidium melanogenum]